MKIAYLTNADFNSGVGYYATCLARELKKSHFAVMPVHMTGTAISVNNREFAHISPWPSFLGRKSIGWIRLRHKLSSAIRHVAPELVHATNQTLSFVRTNVPRILTVHDIIEVVEPQDSKSYFINRYLYRGIATADHIIAVSEYTKQSIIDHYRVPAGRITVIPNGVGPEFHQVPDFKQTIGYRTLCQHYHIPAGAPVLLYVGSDHPRKNLSTVLNVFARLLEAHPSAVLLKVGEPGIASGRRLTLQLIDELGIHDSIRLIGNVSYEDLNLFYNLADALIFPSRFEGFGLPVLQAMATGLPVLTSNVTSLPEVAGEAALSFDPSDVDGFVGSLHRILSDEAFASHLEAKGLARAKQFSWEWVGEQTALVYRKVLAS